MKSTLFLLALSLLVSLALGEEDGITTTASGLKVERLAPGEAGTRPVPGDRVTVHYTGTFEDGSKFDSSRDRGEPFSFVLGRGEVIPGWDEGVALMDVGEKVRLTVPPELAYGAGGRPPKIPPASTLVFEIELLEVDAPPRWVAPDPEKRVETTSGLSYQVIEEGEGEPPTGEGGVSMRFSLFTAEGDLVLSSVSIGQNIRGVVDQLRLGQFQLAFLPEAAKLLRPGGSAMFTVPPGLAFGARSIANKIPANSVTVWRLELVSVNEIPEFRRIADEAAKTTESGLRYEVIREGEGESPKPSDQVEVRYTGWLTDGKLFDSSHAAGDTITFPLGRVIPGWSEGVRLMKPGAAYLFEIPPKLAYGANPPPGSGIPKDATLIFLVELVAIR